MTDSSIQEKVNQLKIESNEESYLKDLDLYSKIAEKLGINIEKTASREYLDDEILPWDNIHYGVNKTWLLDEYKKAQSAISTIPCEVKCNNCGVCSNLKTRKVICD